MKDFIHLWLVYLLFIKTYNVVDKQKVRCFGKIIPKFKLFISIKQDKVWRQKLLAASGTTMKCYAECPSFINKIVKQHHIYPLPLSIH